MQVQKVNIRWAIENAALQEFLDKGFEKASIRSIAERAGISVGNVYRYFKNKSEIFNALVEPSWRQLTEIWFTHQVHGEVTQENWDALISQLMPSLLEQFIKYRKVLMLLLLKSAGTDYADSLERLIAVAVAHFSEHINEAAEKHGTEPDMSLARPIAASFIAGFIEIIRSDLPDDKIKSVTEKFILYHLIPLKELGIVV